jgi:hypothetical protein
MYKVVYVFVVFLFFVCLFVWWCLTPLSTIFQWRSVLLVEDTGVPGENHRLVASHWQTLSHNDVSPEWDSNTSPRSRFELTTSDVIKQTNKQRIKIQQRHRPPYT